MIPIQFVISDIDGTLVRKDKSLSDANVDAVRRLTKGGTPFSLISARPPSGFRSIIDRLDLPGPFAAFNGGTIFDRSGAVLVAHRLESSIARELIALLTRMSITRRVYADGQWFVDGHKEPHTASEIRSSGLRPVVTDDFGDRLDRVDKIVAVSDNDPQLSRFEDEARRIVGDRATIARSQPYYVDITAKAANKGAGIAALAATAHIPLEAVAVIGDQNNDLSMFAAAGFAIAMGQASDMVKAHAHAIAADSDDDGVADAIDRLLLRRINLTPALIKRRGTEDDGLQADRTDLDGIPTEIGAPLGLNKSALSDLALKLLADAKGLLAADESIPTCNRRFAKLGIPQTDEARRAYRELIITTPRLGGSLSGIILHDETIRQATRTGSRFVDVLEEAGIVPGIKVDTGAVPLAAHPGEKITEGLDGLRHRLAEYAELGARFAKWRAVLVIGHGIPSPGGLAANAHALAHYAALCQEVGLLPIVEPEVVMEGDHDLARSAEVTAAALRQVFDELARQRVTLEAMLLKPNMVISGLANADQADVDQIVDATLDCFARVVPAAVPGIVFLSGGQSPCLASARLNALNLRSKAEGAKLPWALSFSFSRAIQQPALEIWRGKDANVEAAQHALRQRAELNVAARRGEYVGTMETT